MLQSNQAAGAGLGAMSSEAAMNGARLLGIAQIRQMLQQDSWPFEYEMYRPFPDVSAGIWRFLSKHQNSKIVQDTISLSLDILNLSLHIRRRPLTFGSERYVFDSEHHLAKAQLEVGELQLDSVAKGTRTRINVFASSLPHDPRFDLIPPELREQPPYLAAFQQLQEREAQHNKFQRLILSDLLARFTSWFYEDEDIFEPPSMDSHTSPTPNSLVLSRPQNDRDWEKVFDWYDQQGESYRMTLEELGNLLGFAESTVKNKRSQLGRTKKVPKSTN